MRGLGFVSKHWGKAVFESAGSRVIHGFQAAGKGFHQSLKSSRGKPAGKGLWLS